MDGLGLCPYDPRHNSTAVFVGELQIPIYFRLFILEREIYRVKTFFPAVKCIYIYIQVFSFLENFLNLDRAIGLDR